MKKIFVSLTVLLVFSTAFASSPLSLVKLYEPMNHLDEIQMIENYGYLNGSIVDFLLDDNNSLGAKTAVMNAFLANNQTKKTAESFSMYLGRKYNMNFQSLDLSKLKAEEVYMLGYLNMVDKNAVTETVLEHFEKAVQMKADSYTINLVLALAKADQLIKENKNCEAFKLCNEVKNNSNLVNDFDPAMESIIFTAVDKEGEGCN